MYVLVEKVISYAQMWLLKGVITGYSRIYVCTLTALLPHWVREVWITRVCLLLTLEPTWPSVCEIMLREIIDSGSVAWPAWNTKQLCNYSGWLVKKILYDKIYMYRFGWTIKCAILLKPKQNVKSRKMWQILV